MRVCVCLCKSWVAVLDWAGSAWWNIQLRALDQCTTHIVLLEPVLGHPFMKGRQEDKRRGCAGRDGARHGVLGGDLLVYTLRTWEVTCVMSSDFLGIDVLSFTYFTV